MAEDWRGYQKEAAAFFRTMGFKANVDAKVTGARATHNIDVWVTFTRYGLNHRWVVECKHWKSAVPKEKVMALASVIQDVGADRGILLSESGFQSGAFQSAEKTSITLTSLEDLRSKAEEDLLNSSTVRMTRKIANLQFRLHEFHITEEQEDGSWVSAPKPGVTGGDEYFRILGELSVLENGLKRGQAVLFPTGYGGTDQKILAANDLRSLLEGADRILSKISSWVELQEESIGKHEQG